MAINFLVGGKLGDFLLGLYGAKGLSDLTGSPINVYMIDIGWEFGFENTYNALYPILMKQSYISDFQMLSECEFNPVQTPDENSPIKVYNKKLLEDGFVVDDYLNSPLLYKKCWSEIYSDLFKFPITYPNSWIEYDTVDTTLKNKVIIHRKYSPERFSSTFPYEQIIKENIDNVIFASTNILDYENFTYNDMLPFLKIDTIEDWYKVINSCQMYVGNLTAPVVIAHSIDKMRIIELPDNGDAYHWAGESMYSSNVYWYLSDQFNNLN